MPYLSITVEIINNSIVEETIIKYFSIQISIAAFVKGGVKSRIKTTLCRKYKGENYKFRFPKGSVKEISCDEYEKNKLPSLGYGYESY